MSKINWLLILIVLLNLGFAITGDICAKLWGVTNLSKWFYIGLGINIFTMITFMTIIRLGGLAITTAIVLLLTILLNVLIGFLVFHEKIYPLQWCGIGLGLIAIMLLLNLFKTTA